MNIQWEESSQCLLPACFFTLWNDYSISLWIVAPGNRWVIDTSCTAAAQMSPVSDVQLTMKHPASPERERDAQIRYQEAENERSWKKMNREAVILFHCWSFFWCRDQTDFLYPPPPPPTPSRSPTTLRWILTRKTRSVQVGADSFHFLLSLKKGLKYLTKSLRGKCLIRGLVWGWRGCSL